MFERHLPYPIFDADNHLFDSVVLWREYADPNDRALFEDDVWLADRERYLSSAIGRRANRYEKGDDGIGATLGSMPGSSLNKLNPYKNAKSPEEREELVKMFRDLAPAYQNRDRRLEVMDLQGVEGAIMFPQADGLVLHHAFPESAEKSLAAVRAFNRWVDAEWGFNHKDRIFVPAAITLMDVDQALAEVDWAIERGTRAFLFPPGPMNDRSPGDPVYDPFWARLAEARVGISIHLNYTSYARQSAMWSENPDAHFVDADNTFTAFQWFSYWGDRPVMETVAAMIFHGLFQRHPNLRIALSEQGSVWLPYALRKMDHAFMMGRKGTFGNLTERPSDTFRRHFLVAPYPEEIISRPLEAVGPDVLTFGSDFPHGEGLADPAEYAYAMLQDLTEEQQRKIMRDNLADFLLPAAA